MGDRRNTIVLAQIVTMTVCVLFFFKYGFTLLYEINSTNKQTHIFLFIILVSTDKITYQLEH